MTLEPIAEALLDPRVLPSFKKSLRNGIVMNRQEQVGSHSVHARHAMYQSRERYADRDQHFCLRKSSAYQLLPYVLRKAKVESELGNAAGAHGPGFFGGVSDVKNDPKPTAIAAGLSRRLQSRGCDVNLLLAKRALHE